MQIPSSLRSTGSSKWQLLAQIARRPLWELSYWRDIRKVRRFRGFSKVSETNPHICPWWIGYFLLSPTRRIFQNPKRILEPYVLEGMNVLEVGPGMGFFSLPLARMVGADGRVFCVDIQQRMLDALKKRARKAELENRIEIRLASEKGLHIDDLAGSIDFALAFAVVHEVGDRRQLFKEIHDALKPSAPMLFSEPRGHVSKSGFDEEIALAEEVGFERAESFGISSSFSIVMKKRSPRQES